MNLQSENTDLSTSQIKRNIYEPVSGLTLFDYLKEHLETIEAEKKVTMHIARHTFGNIAGDAIHPLMLQKLYRHSDLKTTINYQANFIHKEADDALDRVLNF